jgi:membrane protein
VKPQDFLSLLKEAANDWIDDNAMRLAAALAYYAIFSLAPLLVITVAVAGLVFGEEAARGGISNQLQALAGQQAADALQTLLARTAEQKATGIVAGTVSLVVLLFGASGVFGELKDALNTIWGVVVKPGRTWLRLIRDRFLSFSIVLAIGFLLLTSLVLSAALAALSKYMRGLLPLSPVIWRGADFLLSFIVISALFATIFKVLPNVRIGWHDVRIGAIGTAFLFTVGKFLIGWYLGTSSVASSFGAAGSVVIILLWVYYSSCILLFGAEFTKVYARRFGSGIVPNSRAMLWTEAVCAKLSAGQS